MKCLPLGMSALAASFLLAMSPFFAKSQSKSSLQVLFAVWPAQRGKTPDTPLIDPVAILVGSKLQDPSGYVSGDKPAVSYDEFEKTYYKAGLKYPMMFGGSHTGEIEVEKAEGISCESLTATVKLAKPTPPGLMGLAATSLRGLGLHDNWRRLPTSEERSAFVQLATEFLRTHGAANASTTSLAVGSLRSTRLANNQSAAVIGSVSFRDKTAQHNLFLVITGRDSDWEASLSSHHVTKDLEDAKDRVEERFVDQLDLDGDGVDEIVTMSGYYESWDYTIYKQVAGKWQQIYKGGGGGC